MANPVNLQVATRKRGNPNWGGPLPPTAVLVTEFEMQVRKLRLTKEIYTSSRELLIWCQRNRNRAHIPEWLLGKWSITVEPQNSG